MGSLICLLLFLACRSVPGDLRPEEDPGAKALLIYREDSLEPPEGYGVVTFFAYGIGTRAKSGKISLTGHAFVSLNDQGVWGFYPVPDGRVFSKTSIALYSLEWPDPVEEAAFFVDETVLERITRLIDQWREDPPAFMLLRNDCVTFVYQICEVMGIRYSRSALFPRTAVKRIRTLNDSAGVSPFRKNPHRGFQNPRTPHYSLE